MFNKKPANYGEHSVKWHFYTAVLLGTDAVPRFTGSAVWHFTLYQVLDITPSNCEGKLIAFDILCV